MVKIDINPKIRHGKPIIRGTRLTVEEVLGAFAGGMRYEEIKKEYHLTDEQVRAAIAYAFAFLKGEEIRPLVKA